MKVVFFQRKPHPFHYSIEKVFEGIKGELQSKVSVDTAVMPHFSKGFLPRVKNVLWSRRHQGDINHITGDVHYIALALRRRITVLTIHDLNFLNHPSVLGKWMLKIFWLILPVKNVTLVTVISEATKRDLLARIRFPENRIRVIPNYLNPVYKPSEKEFNSTKPRILQIGTKENKNILRVLKALKGIDCTLVIVGNKNESIRKTLEDYHIDYMWLSGLSDSELIEQYQLCDLLIFVSLIEGFGLPIIEAQAVGRSVITSSISAMPEVAGDGACFVDPYNVKEIRQGVLRVINDAEYRCQLISKGFENIKRFELQHVSKQYLNLYQEVYLRRNL